MLLAITANDLTLAAEMRASATGQRLILEGVAHQSLAGAPRLVMPRRLPLGVPRSAEHGRRRFSTRSDYEMHLTRVRWVTAPEKLWIDAELVAAVQRDWHTQGQTGCLFARHLARTLPDQAWPSAVISHVRGAGPDLDAAVAAAIASPDAQLLSVLFPSVDDADALVELLEELARNARLLCASAPYEHDGMTVFRLRARVGDHGVLAWILAFGPFDFLPATRRGPVLELAIRVKPKPERIFRRLDQDRRIAHLADAPMAMGDEAAERTWHATYRAAHDVLGRPTDLLTTAEATLILPSAVGAELHPFRRAER